ncbi:MAG: hypothetical protein LBT59_27725 [Clostridiales bacterium]|jgi:hypothetical protein|nr:hypothetical protein [Clostridiales bacterium]
MAKKLEKEIRDLNLVAPCYKDFERLFNCKGELDDLIKRNLNKGYDNGIGRICEDLIDSLAKQAEADLKQQRVAHEVCIDSLDSLRARNQAHLAEQLKKAKDELTGIRESLEDATTRFGHFKFR